MKITDVRCHVMSVPRPDGTGVLRNWIFVEVDTDEGITGIGEATTEWHEQAVKVHVEDALKSRLLGMDPTDVERVWQMGYRDFHWRRGVVHASAMSGVDQALWDIAGKAAGQPVFKLLGGKVRERVRCYIRGGPEFYGVPIEEAAKRSLALGYDSFKYGPGPIVEPYDARRQAEVAIEQHTVLREILGPDVALMIDAGGLLDPQSAHRLIEGLRPLNMHFVEEPTNMDTVEPTLRLKRDFPDVRIAIGERLITRWDCKPWFEQQAIDVCQVDISHAGGVSELMKIAHYAEVYGITLAPHNPYGPVALAAAAHVAAAIQNFDILEHCPIQPWLEQVQTVRIPLDRGYIDVNELGKRPGLGVELDMDVVRSRSEPMAMEPRRRIMSDGSTPLL
jgi:galactonate dehydratase